MVTLTLTLLHSYPLHRMQSISILDMTRRFPLTLNLTKTLHLPLTLTLTHPLHLTLPLTLALPLPCLARPNLTLPRFAWLTPTLPRFARLNLTLPRFVCLTRIFLTFNQFLFYPDTCFECCLIRALICAQNHRKRTIIR